MESSIFTAAFVKYQTGNYGYSHPRITGHYGFVNGQPLVDCSGLVWNGLYDAGYRLPNITDVSQFTTYSWFHTDTFLPATYQNYTVFGPDVVKQPNGTLQMGDIICWRSLTQAKNPDGSLKYYDQTKAEIKAGTPKVPFYEQHMGIFWGYDPTTGNPMFYASGTTHGPSTDYIDLSGKKPYWNGGHEVIVGVVRVPDSLQTGVDTTQNITHNRGQTTVSPAHSRSSWSVPSSIGKLTGLPDLPGRARRPKAFSISF